MIEEADCLFATVGDGDREHDGLTILRYLNESIDFDFNGVLIRQCFWS